MIGLSDRLRQLREEKDLMQKEVANLLNITTSAYGFYEQGKRIPPPEILSKIADFYSVTTDYLLGREPICDNSNSKNIAQIPSKFTNVNKAKEYIKMHSSLPIEIDKMSDVQIIELANSFLEQINLTATQFQRRILIEHNKVLEKRLKEQLREIDKAKAQHNWELSELEKSSQEAFVAEDAGEYIHLPRVITVKPKKGKDDIEENKAHA